MREVSTGEMLERLNDDIACVVLKKLELMADGYDKAAICCDKNIQIYKAILALIAAHSLALSIVAEQAEDAALWFIASMASEDYLQRSLRRLHAAIEGEPVAAHGGERPRCSVCGQTHDVCAVTHNAVQGKPRRVTREQVEKWTKDLFYADWCMADLSGREGLAIPIIDLLADLGIEVES